MGVVNAWRWKRKEDNHLDEMPDGSMILIKASELQELIEVQVAKDVGDYQLTKFENGALKLKLRKLVERMRQVMTEPMCAGRDDAEARLLQVGQRSVASYVLAKLKREGE